MFNSEVVRENVMQYIIDTFLDRPAEEIMDIINQIQKAAKSEVDKIVESGAMFDNLHSEFDDQRQNDQLSSCRQNTLGHQQSSDSFYGDNVHNIYNSSDLSSPKHI